MYFSIIMVDAHRPGEHSFSAHKRATNQENIMLADTEIELLETEDEGGAETRPEFAEAHAIIADSYGQDYATEAVRQLATRLMCA